jgi:hypothetical protein
VGTSDADNAEIRKIGTPPVFGFESKAHWDIGTDLGILDFERAAKVAGARFSMFIGEGARLSARSLPLCWICIRLNTAIRGAASFHGQPDKHARHGPAAEVRRRRI